MAKKKTEGSGLELPPSVARVRARVDEIFHDSANVREATEQCALDALRLMYESMGDEMVRVRTQAARDVLYVWGRLPAKTGDGGDAPKPLTAEEREVRLAGALEDAEVRAWLERRGWKPPERKAS